MITKELKTRATRPYFIVKMDKGYILQAVVSDGKGFNYKYYREKPKNTWSPSSVGTEIQISSNGPLKLTLSELEQFTAEVAKAQDEIREHNKDL